MPNEYYPFLKPLEKGQFKLQVLIVVSPEWQDDKAITREIKRIPTATVLVVIEPGQDTQDFRSWLAQNPDMVMVFSPSEQSTIVRAIKTLYPNIRVVHIKR